MFRKKNPGKTTLILDVESGGVATGLVHTTPTHAPRLFGQMRSQLPVSHSRDAAKLAVEIEKHTALVLHHASEVAARLRQHEKSAPAGEVEDVRVFLSAPWGSPNLTAGSPRFADSIVDRLKSAVKTFFHPLQPQFHTHAGAVVQGSRTLVGGSDYLLCIVGSEVSELLAIQDDAVVGHATLPMGRNFLLRTLHTHGGMSEAESYSALKLHTRTPEPLRFASVQLAKELRDAAAPLMSAPMHDVYVISQDAAGEWFSKAFAHQSVSDLFPDGGSVRALHSHHASPFVSAPSTADLHLMFDALFVDRL